MEAADLRSCTKAQSKGKPSSLEKEEGNTWNSQSSKRVMEQEPNLGEYPSHLGFLGIAVLVMFVHR